MTSDEIKQLALDVRAGKVVGSWMFSNKDDIKFTFTLLSMMDDATKKLMENNKISHIYDIYRKLVPVLLMGCRYSQR